MMTDPNSFVDKRPIYGPSASDRMQAEIDRLRKLNEHLVDRLAAAVDVLCRKANGIPYTCPHCGGSVDLKAITGHDETSGHTVV